MVRRASSLTDIINVFHPGALIEEDEQNEFYQPTAAVRSGRNCEFYSYFIDAVNTFIFDLKDRMTERRNSSDSERGNRNSIVIIIDGLEKCRQECVRKLFTEDATSISEISAHMVIACPINVHRSSDKGGLLSYFSSQIVMPMIKTHHNDKALSPNSEGINVIKELILKRVDASFFEDGVIEKVIIKTGGSLRDTCYLIRESAFEAHMRKNEKVDKASIDFVLNTFADDLFLRIESKYYRKIKDIFNGDHEDRNDEASNELLYAGVVFKYNEKGWIDLHPLIRDYIEDHPRALNCE